LEIYEKGVPTGQYIKGDLVGCQEYETEEMCLKEPPSDIVIDIYTDFEYTFNNCTSFPMTANFFITSNYYWKISSSTGTFDIYSGAEGTYLLTYSINEIPLEDIIFTATSYTSSTTYRLPVIFTSLPLDYFEIASSGGTIDLELVHSSKVNASTLNLPNYITQNSVQRNTNLDVFNLSLSENNSHPRTSEIYVDDKNGNYCQRFFTVFQDGSIIFNFTNLSQINFNDTITSVTKTLSANTIEWKIEEKENVWDDYIPFDSDVSYYIAKTTYNNVENWLGNKIFYLDPNETQDEWLDRGIISGTSYLWLIYIAGERTFNSFETKLDNINKVKSITIKNVNYDIYFPKKSPQYYLDVETYNLPPTASRGLSDYAIAETYLYDKFNFKDKDVSSFTKTVKYLPNVTEFVLPDETYYLQNVCYDLSSLKILDISNTKIRYLHSLWNLFSVLPLVEEIKLPSTLYTLSYSGSSNTFFSLPSLKKLDFSNLTRLQNWSGFIDCPNLKEINIGELDIANMENAKIIDPNATYPADRSVMPFRQLGMNGVLKGSNQTYLNNFLTVNPKLVENNWTIELIQ
jgi:hypothetical protein